VLHFCIIKTIKQQSLINKQHFMKQFINTAIANMTVKVFAIAAALVAVIPSIALAQGPGFGGGVDDGGVCVPLDGGLSMLAAAGVGYGIKKFVAAKNAKQDQAVK
jgi:hypothetical protein